MAQERRREQGVCEAHASETVPVHEGEGLAIAAHVNSSNGVAMRGFGFGGQTRIAYTQDPHLMALEVTDLEVRGRRSTPGFFNGTRPEYPRRMHCIQGSDAHRLAADSANRKNLGVGDRATDVLVEEASFAALRELFESHDFARTRPHRATARAESYDFVQAAREEGRTIVQEFHETMGGRGGRLDVIIHDVCAFANTNGGSVYVGASPDPKVPPAGIKSPPQAIRQLEKEIRSRISPALNVALDSHSTQGKAVLRILVPRGDDPPYAVDDNQIFIREEAETGLAVRDEIVQLVLRVARARPAAGGAEQPAASAAVEPAIPVSTEPATPVRLEPGPSAIINPPRTGVEIVATEVRDGTRYHTVRDLRNGNVVKNVTRTSARRLWHYAITTHEATPDLASEKISWMGEIGLWKSYQKAGATRYDLVQRVADGLRVYYGVTDDGIHDGWRALVHPEEE